MIICQNLGKKFSKGQKIQYAIEDFSLEIEEGELLILYGPPSSGKTTFLSLLGGLLKADEGSLEILGQEITKLSSEELRVFRQSNIGLHLQTISLFSSLTVLENLLTPLYLAGVSKKAALPKALSILQQVGLFEKKDIAVTLLSEGEKSLLHFGRTLVLEPKILLLDEPTLFLDHTTSIRIMTLLRELVLDHNMTVVAAIGDSRLHPFASRLIRLKSGQILEIAGEVVKELAPLPYLKI
jgi:putative ABC transport system ATP-binding protein